MKNSIIKTIAFACITGLIASGMYFGTMCLKYSQMQKKINEGNRTVSGEELSVFPVKEPEKTSNTDVSGAAECVLPALVSINVTKVKEGYTIFFQPTTEEYTGSASGIIAAQNDGELLIMTNYHVVEDAKKISVCFVDGKSAKATIKGTAEDEDLAVIAVSLAELEVGTLGTIRIATIGRSEIIELGEMVIAIGNALGYGQSTTVGYISAIDREITVDGKTMKLIQTDAAINEGNSGGALVNMRGEVIGINNAKLTGSGVEGMGFAIPMYKAIPIVEELMNRRVLSPDEQAVLGITAQVVSENAHLSFGVPKGIYIKSVAEGSSAEEAGLKKGYIIIRINGQSTYTLEAYEKVMSYTHAGSSGTITALVNNNGEYSEQVFEVVFGSKN